MDGALWFTASQEKEWLDRARAELRRGCPAADCAKIDDLIRQNPCNAAALHLKGLCQAYKEAWSEAAVCFRHALEISPQNGNYLRDLGSALAAMGEWKEAGKAFSAALTVLPSDRGALAGYGRTLLELGEASKAIYYLTESNRIRESGSSLTSLGSALAAEGRFEEAMAALLRALTLEPQRIGALRLLGRAAFTALSFSRSRECWERVLRILPGDKEAEQELLRTNWKCCEFDSTMAALEAKVRTGAASEPVHAFWVYAQLYWAQTSSNRRRNCEEFGQRLAASKIRRFRPEDFNVSRHSNLRIGYLTGEFIGGPPFRFLSALLGNHDFQNYDVFLYHTRDRIDASTDWYSRLANWRDCRGLDDDAIERLIRCDGIQILVDLSGFYPDNCLRIFARRVAPIQATYPNCPTTTGIAEMDYIFTDRWTCKRGEDRQYTERAIYLPSGYLAYSPPAYAPALVGLPALRNGYVTFGVFQRRAKIRREFWDSVGEILRRTDGARLLVQDFIPDLEDTASGSYRNTMGELAARGINCQRVILRGAIHHYETLETMAAADIALDTFPYQGQTTTCECLWQGVPVVALAGSTHASRVGSGLLERAGLRQLVAATEAEYIGIAARLAGNTALLAQMRANLRNRVQQSTLVDGVRLARDVERMYRRMWRAWRRNEFLVPNQQPARRLQKVEAAQRSTRE